MNKFATLITLSFNLVLLAACTSGDDSTAPSTSADVNGVWQITETSGSNTCADPVGVVDVYNLTVTQNGTTLSVSDGVNVFTGTINGSTISWSGSYPEGIGTVTITSLSLTLSPDELSLSGTVNWSYSEPFFSCTGSNSITGINTSSGVVNEVEPNNSISTAMPTSENVLYSGIQSDDDWYQIEVTSGFERVQISLTFSHAQGDIDLELYDSSSLLLASSDSVSDNESIDFTVSSGGTYYIRVHFGDAGNSYSLTWDDIAP